MSNYYEGMPYIKEKFLRFYHSIVNSRLWFNIYYRHTKDWKKQLADVEKRALDFRAQFETRNDE